MLRKSPFPEHGSKLGDETVVTLVGCTAAIPSGWYFGGLSLC
jgi:hypothetical protein